MNELIRIYEAATDAAKIASGLSKSEITLIKDAMKYGGEHGTDSSHGNGKDGGSLSSGERLHSASYSLVKKGLATKTAEDQSFSTTGGRHVTTNSISWTLTDLGKEVGKILTGTP